MSKQNNHHPKHPKHPQEKPEPKKPRTYKKIELEKLQAAAKTPAATSHGVVSVSSVARAAGYRPASVYEWMRRNEVSLGLIVNGAAVDVRERAKLPSYAQPAAPTHTERTDPPIGIPTKLIDLIDELTSQAARGLGSIHISAGAVKFYDREHQIDITWGPVSK